MKHLKYSVTLLFLSLGLFVNGQNEAAFALEGGNSFLTIKQKFDAKIKGSLFINKNFETVKIDDIPIQYPARYNGYTDNFEVKHMGKTKYIVPSLESKVQVLFIESNKTYKIYNYLYKDDLKAGFFVIKSIGKNYDFVVKEKIVYVEEKKPKTPYEKYKNPELKRVKDTYYLRINGADALSEIRLRKKDVIKFFGNDSKTISSLIKKNKLNVKKENDFIQLLKLYDNQTR
ncbi:hypothetical protein [Polaribacter gochangensis]|uniref:hypothetical protein n=1 Tax=Polaribacter gochangensis TaxID=3252903 RepID=UPI003904A3E7